MKPRLSLSVVAAAAILGFAGGLSSCSEPTDPDDDPDTTTVIPKAILVTFAGGAVKAELATLSAQRTTGLMNRASIAADSGMLFVWSGDQNHQTSGFHMVNTHFDLDVAFIDANKRVINIEAMTKETATVHLATTPYRYALEAPKGWFASHGVVAGSMATFTIPAGVIVDP